MQAPWVLQSAVVWEQCVASQREETRLNPNFMLKKDPIGGGGGREWGQREERKLQLGLNE